MAEWRQHLFSKRVHDPGARHVVDSFHVLTTEESSDYEFTRRVLQREDRYAQRYASFMQDCGNAWYVGFGGDVGDVLGPDHEYAHERKVYKDGRSARGRRIQFVHGYFAPKSVAIPDFEELRDKEKGYLEAILQRANDGESPVQAAPALFSAGRRPGTWDAYATAMESGRYKNKGFVFTADGQELVAELHRPDWLATDDRDEPIRRAGCAKKGQSLAVALLAAIGAALVTWKESRGRRPAGGQEFNREP